MADALYNEPLYDESFYDAAEAPAVPPIQPRRHKGLVYNARCATYNHASAVYNAPVVCPTLPWVEVPTCDVYYVEPEPFYRVPPECWIYVVPWEPHLPKACDGGAGWSLSGQ